MAPFKELMDILDFKEIIFKEDTGKAINIISISPEVGSAENPQNQPINRFAYSVAVARSAFVSVNV